MPNYKWSTYERIYDIKDNIRCGKKFVAFFPLYLRMLDTIIRAPTDERLCSATIENANPFIRNYGEKCHEYVHFSVALQNITV